MANQRRGFKAVRQKPSVKWKGRRQGTSSTNRHARRAKAKEQQKMTELAPVKRSGTCSICKKDYHDWGNNAWPVNNGRCCMECNWSEVIPARLALMIATKKAKEQAND